VNVFERALEIIEEHGWYQGGEIGPGGERCLVQAWNEASAELHPWRERWHYRWPGGEARRFRALIPHRARADVDWGMLRAAMEEVAGERLSGCTAQWNDERASDEDVRLTLKIAARSRGGTDEPQKAGSSS
jgi:hypothetical protein